jgi:hypothetical protein
MNAAIIIRQASQGHTDIDYHKQTVAMNAAIIIGQVSSGNSDSY